MLFFNTHMLKWAALLTIWPLLAVHADTEIDDQTVSINSQIQLSIEDLWPISADRDIRTINLNAYYPIKEFDLIDLSIQFGLTATYANGETTQLEGEPSEGTLRQVEYDNEALGLGPVIQAELCVWPGESFSLHFDASGGFILYNKDFPAGGDRYNFMWRAGPMFRYALTTDMQLGLGWQWMHVSNGQGSGPENPSYDAMGLKLQFLLVF